MKHLGIVKPGSTLRFEFDTYNGAGASVTITGLAVTDIEIYKDGSTTQRSSDSGYALVDTDGIDIDGLTGVHEFTVDLADNSVAGFYAAGSKYRVVVSSITADGSTISFTAGTFEIGYPSAVLNTTIATLASQTSFTLTAGPAEDDALNGMWCIIHDVASAVQFGKALILDYTGSTKTVTLAAGTTFTAAAGDNFSVMDLAPLQPTTIGRTLDVSTGGEAGLDWANVGSPTTTLNLSGTSTKAIEPSTAGRTILVSAGGVASADCVAVNGSTTAASIMALMNAALKTGDVDDATFTPTTTVFETTLTTNSDEFTRSGVLWVTGANQGFTSRVSSYAYANSKVKLTLSEALPNTPVDGDTFVIVGRIE